MENIVQDKYTMIDESTGLTFSDAIVLPIDDYNALTADEIEAIKLERFINWKNIIANPPAQSDPNLPTQLLGLEVQ